MVLNDKSGVDGKNLAVNVELNAVTSSHVSLAREVCYELILEVAYRDEGCGIVWNQILGIDGTLEHTAILVDVILGIWHHGNPLSPVQVSVPNV
jgi:hypothetical protein